MVALADRGIKPLLGTRAGNLATAPLGPDSLCDWVFDYVKTVVSLALALKPSITNPNRTLVHIFK